MDGFSVFLLHSIQFTLNLNEHKSDVEKRHMNKKEEIKLKLTQHSHIHKYREF